MDSYADGGGYAVWHYREQPGWHRLRRQGRGTVQESGAVQEKERWLDPSLLPERVKAWTGEYETVTTQEEADALRTQDESKNLLIAAKSVRCPD